MLGVWTISLLSVTLLCLAFGAHRKFGVYIEALALLCVTVECGILSYVTEEQSIRIFCAICALFFLFTVIASPVWVYGRIQAVFEGVMPNVTYKGEPLYVNLRLCGDKYAFVWLDKDDKRNNDLHIIADYICFYSGAKLSRLRKFQIVSCLRRLGGDKVSLL